MNLQKPTCSRDQLIQRLHIALYIYIERESLFTLYIKLSKINYI